MTFATVTLIEKEAPIVKDTSILVRIEHSDGFVGKLVLESLDYY